MAKTGAKTEGIPNWIEYRVPKNKAIDEITERYGLAVEIDKDLPEAEAIAKAERQLEENWAKLNGWNPDEESLEEFKSKQEDTGSSLELPDPSSVADEKDGVRFDDSDEWDYKKSWE